MLIQQVLVPYFAFRGIYYNQLTYKNDSKDDQGDTKKNCYIILLHSRIECEI